MAYVVVAYVVAFVIFQNEGATYATTYATKSNVCHQTYATTNICHQRMPPRAVLHLADVWVQFVQPGRLGADTRGL